MAPFAEYARVQAQMITQAFACGLTNVATLQLSNTLGEFFAHDQSFSGTYHEAFHGSYANTEAAVNYTGACVAHFIKLLRDTEDPAVPGTHLLDNTVLVQVTDHGDGSNHTPDYGPNLIATRLPAFRTGVAISQAGYGRSEDTNLGVLQAVAVGLGLEAYIGKQSHHCIWPCAEGFGGIYEDLLT